MKSIVLSLALLFSSSYSYSSQPTTKEFMDNIDSSKYDSYLSHVSKKFYLSIKISY